MPRFPGDKYPLPPAEIEFRRRRAAEEAEAAEASIRRRERPKSQTGGPTKKKRKNARTSDAKPNEVANAKSKVAKPKKGRVPFPYMVNPRSRRAGVRQLSGYARVVSGGLPELGKRR